MTRSILIYGLILAAGAFFLHWLDYRFWMRDIGLEVYGVALAVFFAGLGMWIERQRGLGSAPEAPNDKAIRALGLTPREVEMLDYLARGKSNKDIARDLGLSPNTIKTHLTHVYDKLGVKNRTEAVVKAADLRLRA